MEELTGEGFGILDGITYFCGIYSSIEILR